MLRHKQARTWQGPKGESRESSPPELKHWNRYTFEYQLGQRPLPRSKNSFYQCDGEHRQKRCSPWHVTPLAADCNQCSQCQAVKAVKAEAKNDREMMVCTIVASILCYSPWLREFQYLNSKYFKKQLSTWGLRVGSPTPIPTASSWLQGRQGGRKRKTRSNNGDLKHLKR